MRYAALLALCAAIVVHATPLPLYGAANLPIDTSNNTDLSEVFRNLTQTFDRLLRENEADGIPNPANETSFSFAVFDRHRTLYTYHHTADELNLAPESTKQVNENSIYRTGSTSKLITVYTFLVAAGWADWYSPMTDYIPELAHGSKDCLAKADPIDCIDWDHVTLETLASQLAGVLDGFEALDAIADDAGLPTSLLGPSILSPAQQHCNGDVGNFTACTSSVYVSGMADQHPVFTPWSQPSYSNGAFQLLAIALEKITNSSFQDTLQAKVFIPLNMTASYSSLPPTFALGVIPFNNSYSDWNRTFLRGGPEGGLYSSTSDLVKLSQGIMNNKLISAARTRQWMRPLSHTSSLRYSVGAPWEILRRSASKGDTLHSVDLYTKGGDVGAYHANLALVPEYDVGYVILSAGGKGLAIDNAQVDVFLNGLDIVAHKQAERNIARTYYDQNSVNNSLTLAVEDDASGINVTAITVYGIEFRATLNTASELSAYPMQLSRATPRGNTLTSWRMVSHPGPYTKSEQQKQELQDAVWLATSNQIYGYTGLNEMLVETDKDGKVLSIEMRALNVTFV